VAFEGNLPNQCGALDNSASFARYIASELRSIDAGPLIKLIAKGRKALTALIKDPPKVLRFLVGAVSGAFELVKRNAKKLLLGALVGFFTGSSDFGADIEIFDTSLGETDTKLVPRPGSFQPILIGFESLGGIDGLE